MGDPSVPEQQDDIDCVRQDAGRYIRTWLASLWRNLPVVGPVGTAFVGAMMYYAAHVEQTKCLSSFSLSPAMFGTSAPSVADIALPAILFGTLLLHAFYRGFAASAKPPSWSSRKFSGWLLRGSARRIAARALIVLALLPAITIFAIVDNSARLHGSFRAFSVRYRVLNQGCERDCVFYQTSTYGPRRMPVGQIGIPVQSGNGLIAVFTASGTVFMRVDSLQRVHKGPVKGAKRSNTSWATDVATKFI